ncbi:tRNA pseudouridine(13) synthase TruD [Thermanaerovibrio acidaminovorans]|jgi:tRNA pseudouridine13 synthase|uniref:tRNA pseudouridine(13) synthase TruD n=1 Tax=Thermanaerovibrio acidaminovorans TaxID=81462 RepID=UPI0024926DEC|nr:tRNA pseudouridine(13) synthase TruD [Thermanaerovibrio acidaminovorans]
MTYALKSVPEDFQVTELLVPGFLSSRGPIRVYSLWKRDLGTQEALEALARANRIPVHRIRAAGRKDRRAVTEQFVTCDLSTELRPPQDARLRLTPVGFSREHVSPSHILGNRFSITVREVEDPEAVRARLASLPREGFPNYFDDQRFRSVPTSGEMFAERLVKGHLNGALRLLLTEAPWEGAPEHSERMSQLRGAWGDFDRCLSLASTPLERRILESLAQDSSKRGLKGALRLIPRDTLSMLFSAYQSFLWNCTASLLIHQACPDGTWVPLRAGRVFMPSRRPQGHPLKVPTSSYKMPPMDENVERAMDQVLAERGVKRSDFNLRFIRSVHFGSFERPTWVTPGDLRAGPMVEHRPGRFKVELEFTLPRGSYATMLIRHLMTGPA